jgi:hypothetical protein
VSPPPRALSPRSAIFLTTSTKLGLTSGKKTKYQDIEIYVSFPTKAAFRNGLTESFVRGRILMTEALFWRSPCAPGLLQVQALPKTKGWYR